MLNVFLRVLAIFLLFLSFSIQAATVSENEKKIIYQDLAKLRSALLSGRYEYLARKAPARIFRVFNTTRKAMLDGLRQRMKNIESKGWRITKLEYGKIVGVHQCRSERIVFIVARSAIDSSIKKITSTNYMIVSKPDGGKEWFYVDGAGIKNREILDQIYGCKGVRITLPERKNIITEK